MNSEAKVNWHGNRQLETGVPPVKTGETPIGVKLRTLVYLA